MTGIRPDPLPAAAAEAREVEPRCHLAASSRRAQSGRQRQFVHRDSGCDPHFPHERGDETTDWTAGAANVCGELAK